MKTELKKTLWFITKQTLGKELYINMFNVMNYFVEEEKYEPRKFRDHWVKLPTKYEEETKSKETTRNLIIAKYLGLLNMDHTLTEIGEKFIENINNKSVLEDIIEECKINFRLNREFAKRSDIDKNSFNKIEPFRIFHDFLLRAHEDDLEVDELDYKYYVSFIPDYDSLNEHYEVFKYDKRNGIVVKSKDDYNKYKKDISNIRHNGLWRESKHIYLDGKTKTFKLKRDNVYMSGSEYEMQFLDENEIIEQNNIKKGKGYKLTTPSIRTDEIEKKIQEKSTENGRKAEELIWGIIEKGDFLIKNDKLISIDKTFINNTNAGYDILAYKGERKVKLEVKSNSSSRINFFMTRNEINVANSESDNYYIILVNLESKKIRILCWKDFKNNLSFKPEVYNVKWKGGKKALE